MPNPVRPGDRSLENELAGIRQDVDGLIRNMEQSIAESEAFIRHFGEDG
ncbi:DUF2959 domain-containing protein [Marinobacter sp. F4206]|nr:DUF2959 domain-containing protein [Marinobacter sp. F4206]